MTDPRIERLTEMVAALRQEGYNRQESIELLYARIEALEAAQQPAGIDHAGWHRLSDVKPLNGAQCLFRVHPNLLHSKGVWVDQSHSLTPSISPSGFYTDLGLFVGNPALIWWSAIEPEAQQPAQATEESSVTAPPAPDGGLVERVKLIIAETVAGETVGEVEPEIWDSEARAVIREIAATALEMASDKNLTWERVALWLEREALQ